jgi:hypothetical protein
MEETMRRREFIRLLGGALGAFTDANVFAAQKSPIARIGYLSVVPSIFLTPRLVQDLMI